MLILRVHAGGGLVQNDNWGVLQKTPGNGNALLFSAGEVGAAFSHHGVVPLGQRHDKVMAAGRFSCSDHILLGSIRTAKTDVIADGVVEQIHILKYHSNVA